MKSQLQFQSCCVLNHIIHRHTIWVVYFSQGLTEEAESLWVRQNQEFIISIRPYKMWKPVEYSAKVLDWRDYTQQGKLSTKFGKSRAHWNYRDKLDPVSVCAAAAAKSLQSCPTLCAPMDGSPPGSCVPGILQARTLEWVAISFSNAWKWSRSVVSNC